MRLSKFKGIKKENLLTENIALIVPSMYKYADSDISYILLLKDNMEIVSSFQKHINELKTREHDNFRNMLEKYYAVKTLPKGIVWCVLAIDSGDSYLDFSN